MGSFWVRELPSRACVRVYACVSVCACVCVIKGCVCACACHRRLCVCVCVCMSLSQQALLPAGEQGLAHLGMDQSWPGPGPWPLPGRRVPAALSTVSVSVSVSVPVSVSMQAAVALPRGEGFSRGRGAEWMKAPGSSLRGGGWGRRPAASAMTCWLLTWLRSVCHWTFGSEGGASVCFHRCPQPGARPGTGAQWNLHSWRPRDKGLHLGLRR